MKEKFDSPPIREVQCAFQFSPEAPWDGAIPGQIYEHIKGEFPQKGQEVEYDYGVWKKGQELHHGLRSQRRMTYTDETDCVSISVGPRILLIRHEGGYESWEEFFPVIERGYQAYTDATGSHEISSASLMYSNLIRIVDIAGEKVDISDYFNVYPDLGKGMPEDYRDFFMKLDFPYADGRDELRLKFGSFQPPEEKNAALRLDLEYLLLRPKLFEGDVLAWTKTAHEEIKEVFFKSMKDRLMETYSRGERR